MGWTARSPRRQGAGDQGLMFGYASTRPSLMRPPICYAHRLVERRPRCARGHLLALAAAGCESQVTVPLRDAGCRPRCGRALDPARPEVNQSDLQEAVMELIIQARCSEGMADDKTRFPHQPTGKFEIGGPVGDCGLTGRKIIVDTYGGMARHGGGAFSGKDPSKFDRSAAYAARYVAKELGRSRPRRSLRDPGLLCDRRRRTDLDHDRRPSATGKVSSDRPRRCARAFLLPYGMSRCSTWCIRCIARRPPTPFRPRTRPHDLQVEGVHRWQEVKERGVHRLTWEKRTRPGAQETRAFEGADSG